MHKLAVVIIVAAVAAIGLMTALGAYIGNLIFQIATH